MRLRIPVWGTALVFVLAAAAARAETITVPAGGDLQAALDAAQPGDVITLEPKATYIGNYVLPNKGDTSLYITIRSAAPDALLPDAGVRMTPAYADLLPKIKSPTLFVPALKTAARANHYKLMFLEFQANIDGQGDIIAIGAGDSTQTTYAQVPYAFILDRLYVHGDPEKGQKRCIALHSRDTVVTSSWVSDCKAIAQDSQAISGFNGPGNWIIENNYLEAAAENFILGGADPAITEEPKLVTANVIFRYNHLSKPLAWRLPILTTPGDVIAAATPAAGVLPAGTYYYKVVARKIGGQARVALSIPSSEVSATLGVNGAVTISWTPVVGAQEYLVYGRTANAEDVFWTTTNPYFTDTGESGSAGKPSSGGTKWSVKNTFELKNAEDITIEGNVFENLWVADQPGFSIVLTPRNQGGKAPWAVVQRVLFQNNIVRHVAGGVNILGTDNLAQSRLTNRITIFNNLFDDLTSNTWGTSKVFQIGGGGDRMTIDHNTVMSTQSTIYSLYGGAAASPTPITNLTITNNMSLHNLYGLTGNNQSPGLKTINAYMMPTGIVTGNVLAGGNFKIYPTGNYFPTVLQWQGDFVNYAAGDYHLIASGRIGIPEHPPAGPDVGADVDVITTETALALSGDIRRRRGYPEVRIITTSLPNGKYKVPYEQSVSCTGGFGPCAWEVLDSSLPAGLAFDPASGTVSGTPTEAAAGSLVLRAYDTAWGYNDATVILPITVDPPEFVLIIGEIPAAQVGEPFRLEPIVSGALGSVMWSVVSGDLPFGVGLDPFSGVIAGTPTMWGTTTALVMAHDSWRADRSAARTVTITVAPTSIQITTSALPNGAYRSRYEAALSAAGGTGSTKWSVSDGRLPDGLRLSMDGAMSGRPRAVGTSSFTVQASDAGWPGNVATRTFSITILARELVLYASDANVIDGTWSLVPDATAAGGLRMWNPNKTTGKVGAPLSNPVNYFEIPFEAEAGVAYRLWVRGKADKDKRKNDSVIAQFSRSVDAAAAPAYRIGTTSGTYVNLADCNGCHLSGWGWQDNGWGVNVMGPEIYFEQSGPQTIRVQVKQDGFSIDQIVLSAERFLTVAPGALKNDVTIIER